MLFKEKVEVIAWNDFFAEINLSEEENKQIKKWIAAGAIVYVLKSDPSMAMGIEDGIIKAFDPLISLMQGISYPITFLMLSGGFILIIMGQKSKGLTMIKWAAVGYIGLQFAPAIMKILVSVGKAMMAAGKA